MGLATATGVDDLPLMGGGLRGAASYGCDLTCRPSAAFFREKKLINPILNVDIEILADHKQTKRGAK